MTKSKLQAYLLTGVLAATGVTVLIVTTDAGAPNGASRDPIEGGGNLSYIVVIGVIGANVVIVVAGGAKDPGFTIYAVGGGG